jgi:hypothetical protein
MPVIRWVIEGCTWAIKDISQVNPYVLIGGILFCIGVVWLAD